MGNRQGPIPVYSFRGNSPTWTTTAPNVRSTPGPVVSNGKWLAIPSQGFSVLLDVETGEVVPGSYNSRSNLCGNQTVSRLPATPSSWRRVDGVEVDATIQ